MLGASVSCLNSPSVFSKKMIVPSLKNGIEKADIPAPLRANLKEIVLKLDIVQGNTEKAIKEATEEAEIAIREGKSFVVICVDVGMDVAAVLKAVQKATDASQLEEAIKVAEQFAALKLEAVFNEEYVIGNLGPFRSLLAMMGSCCSAVFLDYIRPS